LVETIPTSVKVVREWAFTSFMKLARGGEAVGAQKDAPNRVSDRVDADRDHQHQICRHRHAVRRRRGRFSADEFSGLEGVKLRKPNQFLTLFCDFTQVCVPIFVPSVTIPFASKFYFTVNVESLGRVKRCVCRPALRSACSLVERAQAPRPRQIWSENKEIYGSRDPALGSNSPSILYIPVLGPVVSPFGVVDWNVYRPPDFGTMTGRVPTR
jgi:hypothetical protein